MIRKLLIVVVLAIVASLVTLNVTSCSMSSSLKQMAEEQEKYRNQEWYELVIFDILNRDGAGPMSEAAIKKAYVEQAGKMSGPPRAEPSDEDLHKVLSRLTRYGQFVRTANGEYVASRSQSKQ